jgi:hypothetical protein
VLPPIVRVKDCFEDGITPQKTVMEAQQTVSAGDSVGPIKLTNIIVHFQWTMLIWCPKLTKFKTSKNTFNKNNF